MQDGFSEFSRLHNEFIDLLEEAQIFRIRTQGIGVMSKEMAMNYGTVGPVARASGVDFDVRRDDPYWGYDKLKFKVPVRTEGDSFARYRVRLEEMQESINICWQVWDKYNELKATDLLEIWMFQEDLQLVKYIEELKLEEGKVVFI